jgi:predicted regulator of Ras-like GTPase activity (Roadblock/LC7/MglB family)
MDQVVARMTRLTGVKAAAICSHDGLSILAQVSAGMPEEERIAAMTAEIARSASALLASSGEDALQTAVFEAAAGKIVVADVGRGYLVAVTDQTSSTGLLRLEIDHAAAELRAAPADLQADGAAIEKD